jgi:hypothetical protein
MVILARRFYVIVDAWNLTLFGNRYLPTFFQTHTVHNTVFISNSHRWYSHSYITIYVTNQDMAFIKFVGTYVAMGQQIKRYRIGMAVYETIE